MGEGEREVFEECIANVDDRTRSPPLQPSPLGLSNVIRD